jgi:plastocyanin
MTDNKCDPPAFTASAGATLTFNLTKKGTALHNLPIAGEDNQFNTTDDVVSDTNLISGGQTGALTCTAPHQAGEYKFRCDIHPADRNDHRPLMSCRPRSRPRDLDSGALFVQPVATSVRR